jgi:hypothetical protein
MYSSQVLSLLGKGVILGGLYRGNILIPYKVLILSIYFPFVVLCFWSGCYLYLKKFFTSFSYEKKGIECPKLMLLEYKGLCARFTTTIPSSPNHRPKPPSEHLDLDREENSGCNL